MNPIFFIWFLAVVLPTLLVLEGWSKLKKFLNDRGWWQYWAEALLALCVILLIALLALGYR